MDLDEWKNYKNNPEPEWNKIKGNVIIETDLLQIESPRHWDNGFETCEKTSVCRNIPINITVEELCIHSSRVLYDEFPVDKKGAIDAIVIKNNNY